MIPDSLMTPEMGTKARNEFTELPEPKVIGTKFKKE